MDTRDARQVWFLSFLAKHNINEAEFLDTENKEDLMACYIVYLLDGNTIQGKVIKASTAKGYLQAVNVFCSTNGKAAAVNLKLQTSKAVRLLAEQAKFEQLPDRRLPFTPPMTYAIVVKATENESHLSFACAAANWLCVGRLTAQRLQEFAQDHEDEVMIYITPNGDKVVRAYTRNNVVLFDQHYGEVRGKSLEERAKVTGTGVIYDVQKNRDNKQRLDYDRCRSPARRRYDLTENFMQIIDRADELGQPHHLPLAVYQNEKKEVKYLTGQAFTEFVRHQIKKTFPMIPDEELKLYSTHSLRVTAANLLHEAGKDGSYIKLRCRWKSDCYEIYLRNTAKIRQQHAEALQVADDELIAMNVM